MSSPDRMDETDTQGTGTPENKRSGLGTYLKRIRSSFKLNTANKAARHSDGDTAGPIAGRQLESPASHVTAWSIRTRTPDTLPPLPEDEDRPPLPEYRPPLPDEQPLSPYNRPATPYRNIPRPDDGSQLSDDRLLIPEERPPLPPLPTTPLLTPPLPTTPLLTPPLPTTPLLTPPLPTTPLLTPLLPLPTLNSSEANLLARPIRDSTTPEALTRNPDAPLPRSTSSPYPRSDPRDQRSVALFERYGIHLEPGDWAPKNRPATMERVDKEIRMRVHYHCHKCQVALNPSNQCIACGHRRCKKCVRFPLRKNIHGGSSTQDTEASEKSALLAPNERMELEKSAMLSTVVCAMDHDSCGAHGHSHTAPHGRANASPGRTAASPGRTKAPWPPSFTLGDVRSSRCNPSFVIRVSRICHQCTTPFVHTERVCYNCEHKLCSKCPRDPPRMPTPNASDNLHRSPTPTAGSALMPREQDGAKKEWTWKRPRIPTPTFSNDSQHRSPTPTAVAALGSNEQQVVKKERMWKMPRLRVRYTCDQCTSLFVEREKICVGCGHRRCENCYRAPGKRIPLPAVEHNPAALKSLQNRLATFAIIDSGVAGTASAALS